MELHDNFRLIPSVKKLQQVRRAFACLRNVQLPAVGRASSTQRYIVGAVRPVKDRQEHIILGIIPHQFFNIPPSGNAYIALGAFGNQLRVILAEHLNIHQPFCVPVMEIGQGIPVIIRGTYKLHFTIVPQHQVIAHIIRPVGKAEPCIKDVLAPAPLVKACAHGNRAPRCIPIIFRAHVIILKCLQCRVELIQRGGHLKAQIIQPCFVNHGILRDAENAVVFFCANPGGPHALPGRKAVDIPVIHGNGFADIWVFLKDFR